MKAFLSILASVLFATAHGAEPVLNTTLAEVSLANGKSYTKVKVTRVEADALTLQHLGGIARVPFELLPDELQKQFGFDPEEAAAARKASQEQQRARFLLQLEAEMAREKAERIARLERCYCLHVNQVIDDGILVQIHRHGDGDGSLGPPQDIPYDRAENSQIPSGLGGRIYLLQGIKGKNLADHDIIDAFCVESEDTYGYETAQGGRRTVRILEFVRWPRKVRR